MDSPTDLTTSEGSTATAPILLRGTLKHGEVEALFQSPAAMQQSLELSDFESLCGLLSAVLGERELQGPHLDWSVPGYTLHSLTPIFSPSPPPSLSSIREHVGCSVLS